MRKFAAVSLAKTKRTTAKSVVITTAAAISISNNVLISYDSKNQSKNNDGRAVETKMTTVI